MRTTASEVRGVLMDVVVVIQQKGQCQTNEKKTDSGRELSVVRPLHLVVLPFSGSL